jgi:iron complex transport system ATP-binding protein
MSLKANKLSLTVSEATLLKNISLDIKPGKITTVLGPNGAGKTTLLRILAGDLAATAGDIQLHGKALYLWETTARAKMLAILPQHSLLDFPFTSEEVVLLGRIPHDTGAKHDLKIARAALKTVDGDYLATRLYTQLSGGEKQRVHLARVLAQIWEPCPDGERYLILDEPTSSFDLAHQQLTLEIVQSFSKKGVGVLMVIHDLNLAARCADQMIMMLSGEIVISGTAEQVLQKDNIHTVFEVDSEIGIHPRTGKPLVIT